MSFATYCSHATGTKRNPPTTKADVASSFASRDREAAKIGIVFDRHAFNDLTYFGHIMRDEERENGAPLDVPAPLRDSAERWRMFHFHGYLTVALQSFLVTIVGVLRQHPSGNDRARLLDEFGAARSARAFPQAF